MKVLPVNPFIPASLQKQPEQPAIGANQTDFSNALKQALQDVNQLQVKADEAAKALALGEATDIHQVMITLEQAKLAMQLTVQVRNKLIEAYQEISRMQI